MSRVLSTLRGLTRFQSGVGAEDDLRVQVREDPDGRWFPVIHTGFYYLGTEERYLYARKATHSFTLGVSGVLGSFAVSGWVRDPTELGPLLLWAEGQVRPLPRVCSPLRAFRPLGVSGTGDVRSASSSGLLVSLVSHPVTGVLLSVPATGDFASTEDYVYVPEEGRVYLPAGHASQLWATYLVNEWDPDLFRVEEILQVDRDGYLRTGYSPVCMLPGLKPIIRKPGAGGLAIVTGSAVTGNVVQFVHTAIGSGDLVSVQYYVQGSFSAYVSGGVLRGRYLTQTSGVHTLEYETGLYPWYDVSQLTSGDTSYIQLNPLFTARESGFLYLVDGDEPWPSPARLQLRTSNLNPLYAPSGGSGVSLSVRVLDVDGEPVPEQSVTLSASGLVGALTTLFPTNGQTDGKGEVLYRFTPSASGSVTFIARVGSSSVSGQLTLQVRPQALYSLEEELCLGKLLLHLEEAPYRERLQRLNAAYVLADGAPFQPRDAETGWTTTVLFHTERSRLFNLQGRELDRPAAIPIDLDGIASVLVETVPGDVLRAEVLTPTEGRVRTATPVRIPTGEIEHAGEA